MYLLFIWFLSLMSCWQPANAMEEDHLYNLEATLPLECFLHVTSFLPYPDLQNLCNTSRTLRDRVHSNAKDFTQKQEDFFKKARDAFFQCLNQWYGSVFIDTICVPLDQGIVAKNPPLSQLMHACHCLIVAFLKIEDVSILEGTRYFHNFMGVKYPALLRYFHRYLHAPQGDDAFSKSLLLTADPELLNTLERLGSFITSPTFTRRLQRQRKLWADYPSVKDSLLKVRETYLKAFKPNWADPHPPSPPLSLPDKGGAPPLLWGDYQLSNGMNFCSNWQEDAPPPKRLRLIPDRLDSGTGALN